MYVKNYNKMYWSEKVQKMNVKYVDYIFKMSAVEAFNFKVRNVIVG
jgi:hypothetical protein